MKIGVIGLGSFGCHLVRELADLGVEVLAVDQEDARVDEIKHDAAFACTLDVTDAAALARLPLGDLDAVVVAIGEDFRSAMLVTAHLLNLKPKRLVCRAASATHAQLLRALNVTDIIEPESVAAARVAVSLALKGVSGSYELTESYQILEIAVPAALVGRTLASVDLRKNHELNLVTVKRRNTPTEPVVAVGVPPPDFVFRAGDVLVLFGAEKDLRTFIEE
jgi:trk system potassium uptake protein TrkA